MVAAEVAQVLERRGALAHPPVTLAVPDAVALGIAGILRSPTDRRPAGGKVLARGPATVVASHPIRVQEAEMALRPRIPAPRREGEVPRHRPGAPAYSAVLEEAYRLGRADGRLAAAVDDSLPDPSSPTCRGRTAAELATHLWAGLPGDPPAGVEVNARAWYLAGLTDGMCEARA